MTAAKSTFAFAWMLVFFFPIYGFSQQKDTLPQITKFSGALGITNNGFAIIPTFSLNSPAVSVLLSWKKNNFSIDPDIRLTPDGKKGGMLLWLRYYPIRGEKFSLRVGTHPAFSFIRKTITENNKTYEITEMLRFLAGEIAPNYQVNKHLGVGIYYLTGRGLQNHGPQETHFINLNTSISNINIGGENRLTLLPAVYYLYTDGYEGKYFTATAILANTKLPFTLQSSINKTLTSNLPGNPDFLWNISLNYNFSKNLVAVK